MAIYRKSENFGRRRLPNVFSKRQLIKLLDIIDNPFISMAVFGALAFGLRISEVCKLKKTDFNFEDKKVKVSRSKFDRDRYIDIIKDEWVSIFRKWFNITKNSEYAFPHNEDGEQFSHQTLYQSYFDYLKKSDLAIKDFNKSNGNIHHAYVFHTLRHTFCTYLIQKGVPLPDVQKLMGHSSIEVTMRYLHITDNERRDKIDEIFNSKKKKEALQPSFEVKSNFNPLELLQIKFVNGEISKQEYLEKLELLKPNLEKPDYFG